MGNAKSLDHLPQIPFPTFDPFVMYENVPLLSVREIAATKAYTIGRRGCYKDYVDLYFILLEGHATLTEIIESAEKKVRSRIQLPSVPGATRVS
jgi:hypothetical protein